MLTPHCQLTLWRQPETIIVMDSEVILQSEICENSIHQQEIKIGAYLLLTPLICPGNSPPVSFLQAGPPKSNHPLVQAPHTHTHTNTHTDSETKTNRPRATDRESHSQERNRLEGMHKKRQMETDELVERDRYTDRRICYHIQ